MKPRTRKILRWFAIFFAGLLVLFALFLVEEHVRGRMELNRYLKQMRSRGEKFAIAELRPAPTPPEQNGAGLFMAGGFGSGRLVNENVPPAMRYAAPGKAIAMVHRPAWAIKERGHPYIGTNGVTALWRTNATTTVSAKAPPMLATAEDLAADVRFFSNSFTQAHVALGFPSFSFGLNYEAGLNIVLPHLMKMKSTANWLRAASLSALYATNHATSLEELLALATLSRVNADEPLLISQLVRYAIFQIAADATWEALQADGWSDEQLARLQSAFSAFEAMRPMERALEMERAMSEREVDRIAADPVTYLKGWGGLDLDIDLVPPQLPGSYDEMLEPFEHIFKSLKPMLIRYVYIPIWSFAWRDFDRLNLLQYGQQGIDAARWQMANGAWARNPVKPLGTVGNLFNDDLDDSERKPGSLYDQLRFLISSLSFSSSDRTISRAVKAEATKALVVTSLALRRFRLANGQWPDSLEQLVPKYLAAVPLDPFDGKPIRYQRTGDDAFTLYSVSADGRDDHGDASPQMNSARPSFLETRDIVWPRAASPEEVEKFIQAESVRFGGPRTP